MARVIPVQINDNETNSFVTINTRPQAQSIEHPNIYTYHHGMARYKRSTAAQSHVRTYTKPTEDEHSATNMYIHTYTVQWGQSPKVARTDNFLWQIGSTTLIGKIWLVSVNVLACPFMYIHTYIRTYVTSHGASQTYKPTYIHRYVFTYVQSVAVCTYTFAKKGRSLGNWNWLSSKHKDSNSTAGGGGWHSKGNLMGNFMLCTHQDTESQMKIFQLESLHYLYITYTCLV